MPSFPNTPHIRFGSSGETHTAWSKRYSTAQDPVFGGPGKTSPATGSRYGDFWILVYRPLLYAPSTPWWPGRPKNRVGRIAAPKMTAPLSKSLSNTLLVVESFVSNTDTANTGCPS